MALAQMRTFAENLTNMTARDSSISVAFKNIEKISTDLSSNDNIQMTLQNFRESSDKLKAMLADLSQLGPDLKESSQNVKELTATVKSAAVAIDLAQHNKNQRSHRPRRSP